jgi:HSP20 family protein
MLPTIRHRNSLPSIVNDFFGRDVFTDFMDDWTGISTPAVNIVESKDDFRVDVAAPGLRKEDFKINLENNTLTISSEREETRGDNNDDHYMRREFSYSKFSRSFSLPNSVDTNHIKASHKDGVLHISIPKKEEAKVKPAREIAIE